MHIPRKRAHTGGRCDELMAQSICPAAMLKLLHYPGLTVLFLIIVPLHICNDCSVLTGGGCNSGA